MKLESATIVVSGNIKNCLRCYRRYDMNILHVGGGVAPSTFDDATLVGGLV